MTLENAVERMTEAAELAAAKLREAGASVSVEVDYMNSYLKTVDEAQAKFVTTSLVITAEGIPEGKEYCISLGAELRRGNIDAERLECDILKFEKLVDEAADRIYACENKSEAVSALATEAEAEFDKLVEKLNEDHRKGKLISAIGMGLVIIGVVILFIIATLQGVK
jgi:hypothetical protein